MENNKANQPNPSPEPQPDAGWRPSGGYYLQGNAKAYCPGPCAVDGNKCAGHHMCDSRCFHD